MPLPGDCTAPSALVLVPARQPTAAMTAPGWLPAVWVLRAPWTTTSVTMLARKQSLAVGALPEQLGVGAVATAPVGRLTLSKLAPPSVERYRPPPVAA